MTRITINPVFDIASGKLLTHDGQFFIESIPLRFDRSIQKASKQGAATATGLAGTTGVEASGIGSSIIPGLERQAQNPTGLTPIQKNNALVAGGEAAGGVNAGLTGEAALTAARTRTPGGFAASLGEIARQKGRQLSANALNVANEDTALQQSNQRFAQGTLAGIYGQDRANQLKAMGLSDEDLKTALEAGKSGWLQQTEGLIDTIAGARKAFKG